MTALRPVPLRAAAALLAAAASALGATSAHAGTYEVRACHSDGVNRAFWAYATSGLTAYAQCPGADYQGITTGLVARADRNAGGGRLGAGASAWQIFEAPAGAVLQSMSFRASGGRASGCWAFGVFGWDGDAFHPGDHLWGYPGDCVNQPGGWTYFAGPYALDLRGHQKVRMGVRCESAAGCATSSMETWANLKDVSVTVRDDSAPSLSANGGELLGDGWHRGTEWMWAAVRDNVGIRSVYGQLDGNGAFASQDFAEPGWPASVACDFARPRPCADLGSAGLPLDTRTAADGVHALRFVGIDAAGNAASLDRTIAVDNHAPAPPRAVTVSGGEGWRAAGPFDVSWTNPPGQTAPIARVHWRLCRGGACEQGSRDGAAVSSLKGLRVAGAGDWTLALWLEDEAGNADAAQAAEPVHLRLDDVAPSTGGFELQDPADPRRVSLVASDAHSGLAGARIELRERGGGAWRALPTALAADGHAVARIPDAELPDGTYELRALVRDAVGNETVADRDVTGRPMVVVLPLRLATRIVGRSSAARRCRTVRRKVGRRTVSRRVCRPAAPPAASALREPLRLGFGRTATLAGVLETWQGRPVGRAVVEVLERPRTEQAWRRAGAVRTDSSGRFSWRVAAGPSRHVRLAYDGDDLLLPASLEARVLVPAAGTLHAGRRRARNGQSVVFTGRLRGLPLPRGGRTVDLQAHYRGAWRTFATPRTDARGRWRQSYRFGATSGRVVYRFRALIKRDASYPYEQGRTPTVRVTVTG